MAERLSEWAKRSGINPKTAWRMFNEGRLPVPAERVSERVIIVHDPALEGREPQAAIYARVSAEGNRGDLDRQVATASVFAAKENIRVTRVVVEIESVTADRPLLSDLLVDPEITQIVTENWTRIGARETDVELLDMAMRATDRQFTYVTYEVSDAQASEVRWDAREDRA